jgi:hypothetical protein
VNLLLPGASATAGLAGPLKSSMKLLVLTLPEVQHPA